MKRKALVISYAWPPMEDIGFVRASKFAKYLPEYGWEPVILTVKCPSNGTIPDDASFRGKVFRTEYEDAIESMKKFFGMRQQASDIDNIKTAPRAINQKPAMRSIVRRFMPIPDDQIGWYKFAIAEGKKIVDNEKVDIIFSTSPPETSHLIARSLKKYSGLPWVADLRDLWADDHYRQRPILKKILLRFLERRVLRDANHVITVSQPCADKLDDSIYSGKKTVVVIENGFDDADFAGLTGKKNEKFTITYTGKLNVQFQPINIFFKALSVLISEGRIDKTKVDVRFYLTGYNKPDMASMAKIYGLNDVTKELEKVSYEKSLQIQRESDVLLLVPWQGKGAMGWYSAKIFDYLGSKRPILVLAEKGGIIDELIKKTSCGIVANSESEFKKALLNFYDGYIKNGFVEYSGCEEEISKHTRRLRTKSLVRIFESLVMKNGVR